MDENKLKENAPQQTAEPGSTPPPPTKRRRNPVAIAIAAVAVILAVLVVVFILSESTPLKTLDQAFANTTSALEESAIYASATRLASGGSVELQFNTTALTQMYLGAGIDATARIKLYFDSANSAGALTASVESEEESAANATLFFSSFEGALESAGLLGDEAYGYRTDYTEEELRSSFLNPENGSAYALDEETFSQLIEQLTSDQDALADMVKLQTIADGYYEYAMTCIGKYAETEASGEEVEIGGESFRAKIVTIVIDNDSLAEIAADIGVKMQSDEELAALVDELDGYLSEMLQGYTETTIYGYSFSADSDESNHDLEDFKAFLSGGSESIDELVTHIKEEMEPFTLTVTFTISNSTGCVALIDGTYTTQDEGYNVKLTLGADLKTTDEISLYVNNGDEEGSVAYRVTEDSDEAYEAALILTEDGEEEPILTVSLDRETGNYTLWLCQDYSDGVTVEGTYEKSGDVTTITVDRSTENGFTSEVDFTLIINMNDPMPEMPEYTDILTLTDEDMNGIITDVQSNLQSLLLDLIYR